MLWTAMSIERSCDDAPEEPVTRGRRRLPDDRGWLVAVPDLDRVLWQQRIKATCQRLKEESEIANASFDVMLEKHGVAEEHSGGW